MDILASSLLVWRSGVHCGGIHNELSRRFFENTGFLRQSDLIMEHRFHPLLLEDFLNSPYGGSDWGSVLSGLSQVDLTKMADMSVCIAP
jgi:hypothetical protein